MRIATIEVAIAILSSIDMLLDNAGSGKSDRNSGATDQHHCPRQLRNRTARQGHGRPQTV
ncbi:hypothetical protein LY41_000695 [Prauserella halophila]|nr:hypothetical protein [Prauserella halophila]